MTDTTVADDAKAAAEAGAEDGGAQATQDEVERLLQQYRDEKSETEAAKPEPKQEADAGMEARLAALEAQNKRLMADQAKSRTQKGLSEAVNAIKDDLDLPERAIRGMLQDEATSDPRFAQAFFNKDQNPGDWDKILKGKAALWKSEIASQPSREMTEDREAIRAAASSATRAPKAPEGPSGQDLAAMSPEERADDYQKWLSRSG